MSPICYYSFIFGLLQISIGLLVFALVANEYKQIAIRSLLTFVLIGQVFNERTQRLKNTIRCYLVIAPLFWYLQMEAHKWSLRWVGSIAEWMKKRIKRQYQGQWRYFSKHDTFMCAVKMQNIISFFSFLFFSFLTYEWSQWAKVLHYIRQGRLAWD